MENHVRKLICNEIQELNKLKEERLLKEKLIEEEAKLLKMKENLQAFKNEENKLKQLLEKLKMENFSLENSIYAWQTTLNTKLEEVKKAELKLNELYNEIWSKREKFCAEADDFNTTYGILSKWWKNQNDLIIELEKFGQKKSDDQKQKEVIEILQKEIEVLKLEIETVSQEKLISEAEANHLVSIDFDIVQNKKRTTNTSLKLPENPDFYENQNIESMQQEYDFESCYQKFSPPKNELFSIMDIKKVKMLKRITRKKNLFKKKFVEPRRD